MCGLKVKLIFFSVNFLNSWSISAICLCSLVLYAKVELYKFLCLNFFFKFFPAPEKPDFESMTKLFLFISFFLISGIKGI